MVLEEYKSSSNFDFQFGGVGEVYCKPTHPNVSVALYRTKELTVEDHPSVRHQEKRLIL